MQLPVMIADIFRPSKDRSDTEARNRETFLMSNMQPQVPKLNQKTWKYLEDFERELVKDNDAYIMAGCYGNQGRIKDRITIPTSCFKIIALFPKGNINLRQLTKDTRIIAVDMPNNDGISIRWRTYLRSVNLIEAKTDFDFFSKVSKNIQNMIELVKDDGH